jgi:Na+-driven multidrug efflux pump
MIAIYIVLVMALVSSVLLGFYTEKGDQRRVEFIYRYALLVTPILSLFVYIMLLGISLNS